MGIDGLPPNGLAFSCRERAAQDGFKKGPISRAKRSAATTITAGRDVPPDDRSPPIRSRVERRPVITNHSSQRAVTSHQMTGRLAILSRVGRRPVITMRVLGGMPLYVVCAKYG